MGGLAYDWLVTDLDGTLVDRDLRIVERSARAIAAYEAEGGQVVIATGRNEQAAMRFHRALGLSSPLILYNGARVVAPDGMPLLERTLGADWARLRSEVLAALPEGVGAVAFVGTEAVIARDAPALAAYAARDRIELERGPLADDAAVTKLMLITAHPGLDALAERIAVWAPHLTVVASEATYLEILPSGASKGTALTWLADRAGVPLPRIAAIGDNPNDIAMVAVAGLGIAVGDGHAALRAVADVVVGRCVDGAVADGVAYALGSIAVVPRADAEEISGRRG